MVRTILTTTVLFLLLAVQAAAVPVGRKQLEEALEIPQDWELATNESVSQNAKFSVFMTLRRPNFHVVARAFKEANDPKSPRYGQHLTHDQVEAAVRPPARDIAIVQKWLKASGATEIIFHRHGDSVKAVVTKEGAEALCGSELRVFRNLDTGALATVATGGVFVPVEVANIVVSLGGFVHFPIPLRRSLRRRDDVLEKIPSGVTPLLIRKTYGISIPKKSGKRNIQAIAQFQGSYYIPSDIDALCKRYKLGNCNISKLVGTNDGGGGPMESNLDTEYTTSGVAGSDIETWVYGYSGARPGDFCTSFLTFLSDVISGDEHPWVASVSYGAQKRNICGHSVTQRADEDAQKLGAMGVTLIIASGDDGSGQFTRQGKNFGWLAPSWPATIPSALGVGSTFFIKGDAGQQEATRRFGSGGGFSTDYPVQTYQEAGVKSFLGKTKLPAGVKFCVPGHGDIFSSCNVTGRASPDVAFLGDGFAVIAEGCNWTVGGTSASAPGMAAVISLLNEERLATGKTLGFVNPLFYANPGVFNDITVGTNAELDQSHHGGNVGWDCEEGWDAVSGLGTPNFPKMLQLVKTLNEKQ